MSTTLKTGLGERIIPNDLAAGKFESLPIISLAKLRSPVLEERQQLAVELRKAAMEVGFCYLADTGIDFALFDRAVEQSKNFFNKPLDEKLKIDVNVNGGFKGYTRLLGEKVDPASRGDLNESFNMGTTGRDQSEENQDNVWPVGMPDFREAMDGAWDAMMDLGKQLCRTVALALKLDEDYFHDKTRHPGCVFRSVHYPPQQGQIDVRQLGIGSHADYEALTLLKQQEGIEALQVLNRDGQWVSAPPIKDTLVLNFGDQMNRLTNGLFLSTVHRVINRTGVERYSLPFFFGLDYDCMLDVIPSCITDQRPAQFEPILAGEYITQRLTETYLKSDDIEKTDA